jgi:PAS domain S-box-containing protein
MRREEIEFLPGALADRAVARILAETSADETLYPQVLEGIGESLGWELGLIWEAPASGDGPLICAEVWCSPSAGDGAAEFAATSLHTVLERSEGLPGQVWNTGEASWIVDFSAHTEFPRAERAAATGMRSAICSPVISASGILGVIEFFSSSTREPDAELLAAMASLGSQIGQVVERRRAESRAREAGEHHQAIVDAALDCIITIDEDGRVLEFNPAAERTFGYGEAEAVGRDMSELIVPPALRERHREGFARCVREGTGALLGHRIEITGMRQDGSEFPVELTITRIEVPGAPRFTGFVRDITERHLAEAELRASRARIVEAGDEARRRIERDLHDGAQQRLVNVSLGLRLARAQVEQSPGETAELLEDALQELTLATSELRELARGIHPAVLSDGGLEPAIAGLVSGSQTRVRMEEVTGERFPPSVESAAYFVVAEALTNVARYAEASEAAVAVRRDGDRLRVEVRDDGRGGADPDGGSGLRGLADRLAALGGELSVESPPGEGTTVIASIPCA